mmetsp:Transcript_4557/g.6899  ORF Transcript_4557/g.6899 Transcript_4557/m.6899 type:complete len:91 (+) Transcript_4557:29-301(+)
MDATNALLDETMDEAIPELVIPEITLTDQNSKEAYDKIIKRSQPPLKEYEYKIVWLDQNVKNTENLFYLKLFRDLGYSQFLPITSLEDEG